MSFKDLPAVSIESNRYELCIRQERAPWKLFERDLE